MVLSATSPWLAWFTDTPITYLPYPGLCLCVEMFIPHRSLLSNWSCLPFTNARHARKNVPKFLVQHGQTTQWEYLSLGHTSQFHVFLNNHCPLLQNYTLTSPYLLTGALPRNNRLLFMEVFVKKPGCISSPYILPGNDRVIPIVW